ncbi:MAG: peroxiredoxin family protein [Candidatus Methylomirabilia bacterium]
MSFLLVAQARAALSDWEALRVARAGKNTAAPNFTLEDLNGQKVSLGDYRGQPVLLNFFKSCVPCSKQLPTIARAYREFRRKGLAVLAVNVFEGRKRAAAFVEGMNLNFPVLIDADGRAASSYGQFGDPTTYLIDRDGRIVGKIYSGA